MPTIDVFEIHLAARTFLIQKRKTTKASNSFYTRVINMTFSNDINYTKEKSTLNFDSVGR